MLEGYSNKDKTSLRDSNKEVKTSSESKDIKNIRHKEIVLDSVLHAPTDLQEKVKENNTGTSVTNPTRQNSTTRVSSKIPGSPQPQLKTLNIQNENFNMEIKVTSLENIRVEVEIEEQNDSDTGNAISDSCLRDESKSKLKRLGKLYAGNLNNTYLHCM